MIVDRPMVLVRGEDARWLLQIVKPRLLELHREGVTIGGRARRLVAEHEQLDARHREFVEAKLAEQEQRTSELAVSRCGLLSTKDVARLGAVSTRWIQRLVRDGVLAPVSVWPHRFDPVDVQAWIEQRKAG